MSSYQTHDIILELPVSEFTDNTVNAIGLASIDASLVISRGLMPVDATLESVIDEQMNKLGSQLKNLHYAPRKMVQVGVDQRLNALEIQSRFTRGEETIHQYQLAFVVPGTRMLMALTYTRTRPLSAADAAHWEVIKRGLKPNQRI